MGLFYKMNHPYGIVFSLSKWESGFAIRPVGMVHFVESTGWIRV